MKAGYTYLAIQLHMPQQMEQQQGTDQNLEDLMRRPDEDLTVPFAPVALAQRLLGNEDTNKALMHEGVRRAVAPQQSSTQREQRRPETLSVAEQLVVACDEETVDPSLTGFDAQDDYPLSDATATPSNDKEALRRIREDILSRNPVLAQSPWWSSSASSPTAAGSSSGKLVDATPAPQLQPIPQFFATPGQVQVLCTSKDSTVLPTSPSVINRSISSTAVTPRLQSIPQFSRALPTQVQVLCTSMPSSRRDQDGNAIASFSTPITVNRSVSLAAPSAPAYAMGRAVNGAEPRRMASMDGQVSIASTYAQAVRSPVTTMQTPRRITTDTMLENIQREVSLTDPRSMRRAASVATVARNLSLTSPRGGSVSSLHVPPHEVRRSLSGLGYTNANASVADTSRDMESLLADLKAMGSATLPVSSPRRMNSNAEQPMQNGRYGERAMQRAVSAVAVAVNPTLPTPRSFQSASASSLHTPGSSQLQLRTPRTTATGSTTDNASTDRSIPRGASKSVSSLPTYSALVPTAMPKTTTSMPTPVASSSFLSPRSVSSEVRSYSNLNAATRSPHSMYRPVSAALITPRGMPCARVG